MEVSRVKLYCSELSMWAKLDPVLECHWLRLVAVVECVQPFAFPHEVVHTGVTSLALVQHFSCGWSASLHCYCHKETVMAYPTLALVNSTFAPQDSSFGKSWLSQLIVMHASLESNFQAPMLIRLATESLLNCFVYEHCDACAAVVTL